ncbi:hypothetical protein VZ52_12265 [Ralstonia mannitolilytica]|nr:hypothetical protein VZ52_12265 [Ralstonia mannitolilytica]
MGYGNIGAFLRNHALKLVACVAVGAGVALASTWMISPLWQAKAIIQNGQLYWVTSAGPTVVTIEPPARTVDRIKVTSFQDTVLKQLNLPVGTGVNAETDLIRRSFDVRLLRNSDLIELSVQGYSPTDAARTLQQYVRNLIEEHSYLAKPTLARFSEEARQVQADLSAAQALQSELARRSKERYQGNITGKFSENVLLDNMVSNNAADVRLLQQRRNTLLEQLNPERTFNTRMIGEIEVSREPVFPKRPLFVVSGSLVALLLGLAWTVWRAARRNAAT